MNGDLTTQSAHDARFFNICYLDIIDNYYHLHYCGCRYDFDKKQVEQCVPRTPRWWRKTAIKPTP